MSPSAPSVVGRPTFSSSGLAEAPLCRGPEAAAPVSPVEVSLFVGTGVSEAAARDAVEAAQQVWSRLGMEVRLTAVHTLDGGAPRHLFEPSAADDARRLAPLQALLHAVDGASAGIPMVVLPRFEDGTTALSALRGLTVPASGTAPSPDDDGAVWASVQRLPRPVVFLNAGAGPRAPGDLSLAPAHELGHALGLSHRREVDVLMSAGPLNLRCVPGLSDTERASLGTLRAP